MKKLFLIMLLIGLAVMTVYGQAIIEVEIGDGTTTTSDIPFSGNYYYGWSTYILTAEQIGTSMLINEIQFDVSNNPSNYRMNNQQLYLKQTTVNTVSNSYPDPANNDFTLVFDGSFAWEGSGWQSVILDSQFQYDGSSNLQLVCLNNHGSENTGYPQFKKTDTGVSSGAYNRLYASFPTTSGTTASYFPNTKLIDYGISSITPSNHATHISLTPTLSLEVDERYTNFELYFGVNPNPETSLIPFSPVGNTISYSLEEPLEYWTDYYWSVVLYDVHYEITTFNFSFKTKPEMDGLGSEESPYLVSTITDLIRISSDNYFWDKCYLQTNNIDVSITLELNEGAGFSPIGHDYYNPFKGSYDGQGYTISNLYINRPSTDYIGLFGHTIGVNISNLGLVNAEVIGSAFVGGLVGYADSGTTINNSYATGTVGGLSHVGGLVGITYFGTINNCYATGDVSSVYGHSGGLVGMTYSVTINNCYATGDVSSVYEHSGGLVGSLENYSSVTNSFWDIETSGQAVSAGGAGKTTVEMKTIQTYLSAGWDFASAEINDNEDVWTIHPNHNSGYPFFVTEHLDIPLHALALYPNNELVDLPITDDLVWHLDYLELTSGYRMNLGTNNPPTNLVNNQDLGLATNYEYSNLEPNTTYYWQIVPYNDNRDAEDCPIWSFTTGSAGVVSVGSGPNTTDPLPINHATKRSYSQSIYLQSELNLANRQIEKLGFYLTGEYLLTGANQWKVYLGHTDKAEFNSTNDWLLANQGLTQVADVTLNDNEPLGWVELELTAPFAYNNSDNLIVGVIEYSPETSNYLDFYTVETESSRSLSFSTDSTTPNPNIPYNNGVLSTSIPKINFSFILPQIELPELFTFEEDGQLLINLTDYFDDWEEGFYIEITGNENITTLINGSDITLGALPDWYGTENISLTVYDNEGLVLAEGTTTIIVTPVNDAPTIELPESFTFEEDGELVVDMSNYVFDVDGDELIISVTGGENVYAEIDGLTVTFTAFQDWHGSEFLTFTIDDGVDTVLSSVSYQSRGIRTEGNNRLTASATTEIIVTPVNDAPTIELPESFTFEEDGELVVDMSNYVFDVDGDPLTLFVTGGENVYAEIDGLMVTFSATPDWFGTEQLTFTVDDGIDRVVSRLGGIDSRSRDKTSHNTIRLTASATVDIIVTPVNDAPTIELPESFTFEEDGELVVDMSNYVFDVDGDELSLSITGLENVTAEINGLEVTFGALPDWYGSEIITVTVDDNVRRLTASATTEIIVTPVNDAPTIELPESFTFEEDGELVVDMSNYVFDVDGDPLTLTVTDGENVYAEIDGLMVTFSATPDWFGTEQLTFTVDDRFDRVVSRLGGVDSRSRDKTSHNTIRLTASATVDIIVTPVNDAPTIQLPESFTFEEDGELVVDMSQYVADIDGDDLSLSITGLENVTAEINGLEVTFGALPDWYGSEIITVTVDDNVRRLTASTTTEIIVTPVNDAPEIVSFVPEETELTLELNSSVEFSVEAIDVDSELTYAWYFNEEEQESTTDEFTYQFTESMVYEIKVIVSDEEYSVEQNWSVNIPVSNDDNAVTPLITGITSAYPNPFNPDTTIQYSLKEAGKVSITIYDLRGRLVRQLHQGYEQAGTHNVTWNGLNRDNQVVASGVYYIRLESSEGFYHRKITLMK